MLQSCQNRNDELDLCLQEMFVHFTFPQQLVKTLKKWFWGFNAILIGELQCPLPFLPAEEVNETSFPLAEVSVWL